MNDIIAFAVFILAYLCAMCLLLFHQLHMFQLNSYKPKVHFSRIVKNEPRRICIAAGALLGIPAVLLLDTVGVYIAAGIMFLCALLSLPGKAKKPLVFTKRVIRLSVVLGIIIVLIAIIGFIFTQARLYVFFIMSLLPVLACPIVLLANAINSPIEKSINNGFIRQAKQMIDDDEKLQVIGVTGSYGKTSLKFFLGKLLSQKYNTLITPESYNTTLGVVRTIREQLRPIHEFFVCEMGARNVGDIEEICQLVSPDFGVITSVGEQHLESFGSLENIINTKFELADSLPDGGTLFVNFDSAPAREQAKKYKNVIGYGCSEGCSYRASNIKVSEKGSSFTVSYGDGESVQLETKLLGEHNVLNITGAVAVAHTMGVPINLISAGVRKLEAVQHRLQLIQSPRGIMIDDAYNSNPNGAKAALEVLAAFDAFRILVTPGMVELGDKQYECNYEFGKQAAEAADIVVLIGEKQTKPIFEGLLAAGYDKNRIIISEELFAGIKLAENAAMGRKQRVFLLENDLPDNY